MTVIFATLAFGLGDSFVRTGGAGPPPYVDPNDLLQPDQAPGAPFVKFRRFDDNYVKSFEQEEAEAAAVAAEPAAMADADALPVPPEQNLVADPVSALADE